MVSVGWLVYLWVCLGDYLWARGFLWAHGFLWACSGDYGTLMWLLYGLLWVCLAFLWAHLAFYGLVWLTMGLSTVSLWLTSVLALGANLYLFCVLQCLRTPLTAS
jgi:hypothetical protein